MTLTDGVQIGAGRDAGERVQPRWARVADRAGELVPAYGFFQAERELAAAGLRGGCRSVVGLRLFGEALRVPKRMPASR